MTVKSVAHRLADDIVRRLPGDRLPTRWNGAWLRVPRRSWESVYRNYEPYLADVLRRYLEPGGCFLDVGAHIGWWSLFAAVRVGAEGRVLAVEPSAAFERLAANATAYPQITALRMGAGAERGTATFFGQGISTSGSFVEAVTAINRHYQAEVPVTSLSVPISTLDDLVATHCLQPSLLKIDVEGYEENVLQGAPGLLGSGIPWVIEIHPAQLLASGGSPGAIHERLERHGYSIDVIDRNANGLYTVLATRDRAALSSPRS